MANFILFRGFKEDTEVIALTNIDIWKKYLERRAEFEHKYYEKAVEWITDIQNEIKKLPPNTTENGDHWRTALECDVAATKIRADASHNVAKYDRKALDNLNSFIEDNDAIKSIHQYQQNLMKAKKSYAKIVSKLDAKQKKVTQAKNRLLYHFDALCIGAASDRKQEKLERNVEVAAQDYHAAADEEETKRQRLVYLSIQYETKVKEAIKDKIRCVVSTWKKLFENHTKHLYHKRCLHYNGLLAIKEMNIDQFVDELANIWKLVITVPSASMSVSNNNEDTEESAIDFNMEMSV